MQFTEIQLSIRFKENIHKKDLPAQLSKAFNAYFLASDKLKAFHKENKFKLYSYFVANDSIRNLDYNNEDIYTLKFRYFDEVLFQELTMAFYNIKNPVFQVLHVKKEQVRFNKEIKTITCVSPAIISVPGEEGKNKSWLSDKSDLDFVKDRIIMNVDKKYKELYGEDLNSYDFIERIELLNNHSYGYCYKNIKMFGNRFRIHLKDDLLSKKLGYFILGAGLLEKNSLSFGFCEEGV